MGRSLSVFLLGLLVALPAVGQPTSRDEDGNGLLNFAVLQDWDGDGSDWTVCRGPRDPLPKCKAIGQRIYQDWIDDVNSVIHGTGPTGAKMERNGVIYTGAGTLVSWPCWDARQPVNGVGTENDPLFPSKEFATGTALVGTSTQLTAPGGTDFPRARVQVGMEIEIRPGTATAEYRRIETVALTSVSWSGALNAAVAPGDAYRIIGGGVYHDEQTDPAFQDCAEDETGAKLINFAPRYWQGRLEGAGYDPRYNTRANMGPGTDRPNGPLGTVIYQDYNTDDNSNQAAGRSGWFNGPSLKFANKNRHVVLGVPFENEDDLTWVGAGAKQGWTFTETGGSDINPDTLGGFLCVNETTTGAPGPVRGKKGGANFVDDLDDGDVIVVEVQPGDAASDAATADTFSVFQVIGDGPSFTTACGVGGIEVQVGAYNPPGFNYTDPNDRASGIIFSRLLKDGMEVGVVSPQWFESATVVADLAIEGADFYGEEGGDCTSDFDGPWNKAGVGVNYEYPENDTHQCDTGHLAAIVGPGRNRFERVAFKHFAGYAVDGKGHYGTPHKIDDSLFLYGYGGSVIDGRWNLFDVSVARSTFSIEVFSLWPGPMRWERVTVADTTTPRLAQLFPGYGHKTIRDLRLESMSMGQGFWIERDVRGLTIDGVEVNGWQSIPSGIDPNLFKGGIRADFLYFNTEPPNATTGNSFRDIRMFNSIGNIVGFEQFDYTGDIGVHGNVFDGLHHDGFGVSDADCVANDDPHPCCEGGAGSVLNYCQGGVACSRDRGTTGIDDLGEWKPFAANLFTSVTVAQNAIPFGVTPATGGSCKAEIQAASGTIGSGGEPRACLIMREGTSVGDPYAYGCD